MKGFTSLLLAVILPVLFTQCFSDKPSKPLSVLVITGGHGYDTAEFEQMFMKMPGIVPEFAVKPHAWDLLRTESPYDVLVFYDMYQEIAPANKELFLAEFEKGTGVVFLHHSLGSHQEWPEYAELVGGKFYHENYTQDTSKILEYYHDIKLDVMIIDRTHPVTKDMQDYEVIDEGYMRTELKPGLDYLLETDHPQCDRYTGWSHKVRNSRVVYLMGGHDRLAFENESFSQIVENAVQWVAEPNP